MPATPAQLHRRLFSLLLALTLAWLPLNTLGLPVATAEQMPPTERQGEHAAHAMPCHGEAPIEPVAACPDCDPAADCECCNLAVPASLPVQTAALGEARCGRTLYRTDRLPASPEPPLFPKLRPPRG